MKQSFMLLVGSVGLALDTLACTDLVKPDTIGAFNIQSNTAVSDTALHIHSTNVQLASGLSLELTATRHTAGHVTGVAVNPDGLRGSAVEVVSTNDLYEYWCVNVAIENSESLEGFNFLWYVLDVGDGKSALDKVATRGGFGISCATHPEPATSFEMIGQGDFRTQIRAKS